MGIEPIEQGRERLNTDLVAVELLGFKKSLTSFVFFALFVLTV